MVNQVRADGMMTRGQQYATYDEAYTYLQHANIFSILLEVFEFYTTISKPVLIYKVECMHVCKSFACYDKNSFLILNEHNPGVLWYIIIHAH